MGIKSKFLVYKKKQVYRIAKLMKSRNWMQEVRKCVFSLYYKDVVGLVGIESIYLIVTRKGKSS